MVGYGHGEVGAYMDGCVRGWVHIWVGGYGYVLGLVGIWMNGCMNEWAHWRVNVFVGGGKWGWVVECVGRRMRRFNNALNKTLCSNTPPQISLHPQRRFC